MAYTTRKINKNELYIIKPLWEKLNAIHLEDSCYFKEHFRTFTFEKRCEMFQNMQEEDLSIEIAEGENGEAIGYCMATKSAEKGKIESLFVEEEYRVNKIGKQLVEDTIKWMKDNGCTTIEVSVAEGHEKVFGFYRKFGFYPRSTILQIKE